MVKDNFVSINVILDRSGSMEPTRKDVIGGFNTFLQEQKKVPGKAIFTLAQFDDQYELVYDGVDINEVKELTDQTFVPRGLTSLLDAIGNTVNAVGSKLSTMNENDRPSKVIFLVITDGAENNSKSFIYSRVKEMVEHQTNKYKWEFIFMGTSSMDTVAQGSSMGFAASNSFAYNTTKGGTSKLYRSVSASISNTRLTGESVVSSMDAADLLVDDETDNTSTNN